MSGEDWVKHENPGENNLFVELRWKGESAIFFSQEFENITIAEAAERSVAYYLMEYQSGLPEKIPEATVYAASGRMYGPFVIDISISIEVVGLRGGQ